MNTSLASVPRRDLLLDAAAVAGLQQRLTVAWHDGIAEERKDSLLQLVAENHRRNFDLWHAEDEARRDDLGFEYVYRAKRRIDLLNQQRNDLIEAIDDHLAAMLPPVSAGCPIHSETPGMIIDRLSILALKDYHMAEQAERREAGDDHVARCEERLAVIRAQRADLVEALGTFAEDLVAGRRCFRRYRQFKMYNDATLNPQLYRQRG